MANSNEFLDIEQTLHLLSKDFSDISKIQGKPYWRNTNKGIIAIHRSKVVNDSHWFTSLETVTIEKEIDFVAFVLGYDGVLILPKDFLLSHAHENKQIHKYGRSFGIRIEITHNEYTWITTSGKQFSVQNFFYTNTCKR